MAFNLAITFVFSLAAVILIESFSAECVLSFSCA